ncbi:MAG: polysaccharide deacetylase family protein [bacterium]|nr:polysaccharide deacetylase family protein [bacterium]
MLKITTSWDDGDILDKRLSDLLSRYDVKGTFYISKDYRPERLSDEDLRDIVRRHEIGAHTLTHPDLRAISTADKKNEIRGSKQWLEELLGSEVKMFCYPKGLHDDSTVEVVREAGFLGARITKMGSIISSPDPFRIDTTIQVYPFPFRKLDGKRLYLGKLLQPYIQRASKLRAIGAPISAMYSWQAMARRTFDIAYERGDTFHLWGHSWEVEKYDMWDELEKFLQYIRGKKDCVFLTNSELLK